MSYIIKNTSGLVNTRVTDLGRRRISQGNFNIAYFQIGDSEVNYQILPVNSIVNNNILMPAFNAQNNVPRQSNKQNIKYPFLVSQGSSNTYGIPYLDSVTDSVYNTATPRGFFATGSTGITQFDVQISSAYTITSNFYIQMSGLTGQTGVTLTSGFCSTTTGTPKVNHFITIYYDKTGSCSGITTSPILTYKIQSVTQVGNDYFVGLDRNVPNFSAYSFSAETARAHIYPSGMTELYDTITPQSYWQIDTLNFETPCDVIDRENTLIWNMNIPWTETPAGVFTSTYEGYLQYNSLTYNGTKELLGYQENSGQTDTDGVYYYNSFDEKITLSPSDQKAIAIIHFTNNDIDFVYGEKFATQPYDASNPIGSARNFKLSLPTIMWHKTTGSTIGVNFYIDPPNYPNYFNSGPYYIKSKVNTDMNDPGIRYYHLWDNNPDSNNNLNRVGKVFPDQEIIIIDDEELVAAMSYKSNRNWTLPAPKLSLVTPNFCTNNGISSGIMTQSSDTMWVTYRFDSNDFTESLHCNYYQKIKGPNPDCTNSTQNVALRFGKEFPFLRTGDTSGYTANNFKVLCQKVTGDQRPNPAGWIMIDFTSQLTSSMVNGFITENGLTGNTFEITLSGYTNGTPYDLSGYINLPKNGETQIMNFGEEFYFYGNLNTDITATIYEMKYLITLNRNQFLNTTNPTWTSGTTSYVSEIGLYNEQKELMIISKLQSPEIRRGIQQFVVKLDF